MKLADRLKADETILTAWSSLATLPVIDILARSGFDAVTLDMQHGAHQEASVHDGLQPITGQGKGAAVRIPVGRNDMASRALDFGAEAVIAPMINSKAEAQAFANAMKYPPLGERSWGPNRALQLHGLKDNKAYLASANANTLAFAMIETRKALGSLDEILDVEGVDGVFVGPSDFSISWTDGADVNPYIDGMLEAVAMIAEKARVRGKHTGLFVFDPARAQSFVDMGYRFLAITNDVAFLLNGAAAALDAARQTPKQEKAASGY